MEFKPHPYQQHCIDRIVNDPAVGLFLDMGLGKSVITLTAVRILKYDRLQISKVLIIAPKKVAESTWSREASKWDHTQCLRLSKVLGPESARRAALETQADVYIINRENVPWLVEHYRNKWPFDMVVIDESTSFKSHQAKRFKALAAVRPHIRRIVELTGTPSPNSLMDLWTQIYLLDGGQRLGTRFSAFRDRYFRPGFRSQSGIVYSYELRKGSDEAIMSAIDDICISMKAEDYLQLPEIIYHDVTVHLDEKARKAYEKMERDMVMELQDDEITATSAAALSTKLLQLSNGAVYDDQRAVHRIHDCKIDALLEMIESLQGRHVLIFYSFQHDRDRILEALKGVKGLRTRTLDGPEDEAAWNAGEIDVLLAHPASCAYGLNLQDGGSHVIWFGLTWNYEQYTQANARLHRQGQKEPVVIHHMISEGTRDEDVIRALGKKEKAQDYVLESLKARVQEIRGGKGK